MARRGNLKPIVKERREQELVYLVPSLKRRIDILRGTMPRSIWIERAILLWIRHEESPTLRMKRQCKVDAAAAAAKAAAATAPAPATGDAV